MDRSQRIRLVVAIGTGLFALFVAFIGAPVVAMIFWPSVDISGDFDNVMESMFSAQQVARVTNLVSVGCLAGAGVCFVYALVVIAAWFIGPPE